MITKSIPIKTLWRISSSCVPRGYSLTPESHFLSGDPNRVNVEKSKVSRFYQTDFLGFTYSRYRVRTKLSKKSLKRFKDRVRQLTSPRRRVFFIYFIKDIRSYILGWKGYFGRADCKDIFRKLDTWIRRRIRYFIWQQLRKMKTRVSKLKKFGASEVLAMTTASSGKGAWRISGSPGLTIAFPNSYFDRVGLPRLFDELLT